MVTIVEIAKETGFSKSTVSAVLAGGAMTSHASEKTRNIILKIARQRGYCPNQAARSLRQKQSNLIAILDATNFSSYAPEILHGINDILRQNHCQQMHCIFKSASDLKEQLQSLNTFRPDGWIVIGYLLPDIRPLIQTLIDAGNTVVQVCTTELQPNASGVHVDPYNIGKMAANYLVENHHKHILYAASSQGTRCLQGFKETIENAGMNFEETCTISDDGPTELHGRRLLHTWIEQGKKETAIFAFNDVMAGGILSEAFALGIKIPEELSVLGLDDLSFTPLLSPPLTTIHLPQYERGRQTGELLMELLQSKDNLKPKVYFMFPKIIQRASCSPLAPQKS